MLKTVFNVGSQIKIKKYSITILKNSIEISKQPNTSIDHQIDAIESSPNILEKLQKHTRYALLSAVMTFGNGCTTTSTNQISQITRPIDSNCSVLRKEKGKDLKHLFTNPIAKNPNQKFLSSLKALNIKGDFRLPQLFHVQEFQGKIIDHLRSHRQSNLNLSLQITPLFRAKSMSADTSHMFLQGQDHGQEKIYLVGASGVYEIDTKQFDNYFKNLKNLQKTYKARAKTASPEDKQLYEQFSSDIELRSSYKCPKRPKSLEDQLTCEVSQKLNQMISITKNSQKYNYNPQTGKIFDTNQKLVFSANDEAVQINDHKYTLDREKIICVEVFNQKTCTVNGKKIPTYRTAKSKETNLDLENYFQKKVGPDLFNEVLSHDGNFEKLLSNLSSGETINFYSMIDETFKALSNKFSIPFERTPSHKALMGHCNSNAKKYFQNLIATAREFNKYPAGAFKKFGIQKIKFDAKKSEKNKPATKLGFYNTKDHSITYYSVFDLNQDKTTFSLAFGEMKIAIHHEIMHGIYMNLPYKEIKEIFIEYFFSSYAANIKYEDAYNQKKWSSSKAIPKSHVSKYSSANIYEDFAEVYGRYMINQSSSLRSKAFMDIEYNCDATLLRKAIFIRNFLSKKYPEIFSKEFWQKALSK